MKNKQESVYNINNFARLTFKQQHELLLKLRDPVEFAERLLGIKLFDYQKEILLDTSPRLHIRKGRQVGASFIVALYCVYKAVTQSDITIAVVAPSQRQSSLVFKYIKTFFVNTDILKPEVENPKSRYSQTVIELANGSIIYSLPCGNDGRTIRGISIGKGSILIVDEAAFIPEAVWASLDYFTATGGREILSSTPLGKRGRFWEASEDALYKHMIIPSTRNPLITKEWIDSRRKYRSFESEIMAEFMTGEGMFFDAEIVRRQIDADLSWNETPGRVKGYFKCAGVDLGLEIDPTVITCCKKVTDKFIPFFIKAYKKKNDKSSYDCEYTPITSYDDIVNEMDMLNGQYDINYAAIDSTNNEYVSEVVGKHMTVFPIKFNSTGKNGNPMKSELMHCLLAGLASNKIVLPNHPTLIRQLLNYEFTINDNKKEIFTPTDEDFIDSLALSVYNELAIEEPDNFAIS